MLHVDFKLLLSDSFSLLTKLTFVAHILEGIHSLDQTWPDFDFYEWIWLRFKIFVNGWLLVNRQSHNALDDTLQNGTIPHDHQISMARVLLDSFGVSSIEYKRHFRILIFVIHVAVVLSFLRWVVSQVYHVAMVRGPIWLELILGSYEGQKFHNTVSDIPAK